MSGLILSRLISCDEAGFTGNRLLDREQPYFAYASVDLSTDEAVALIGDARRRMHGLQMPELKASKLLKTEAGRALILEVLRRLKADTFRLYMISASAWPRIFSNTFTNRYYRRIIFFSTGTIYINLSLHSCTCR